MLESIEKAPPRTTTDIVFDQLYEQIQTLKLLPGTRLSEAEVASKLGVSRQPVRDAFNRLANLNLLKIRPQRATLVSGFSLSHIENTRFVRLAVELEVVRSACRNWTDQSTTALEKNLEKQRTMLREGQIEAFHNLDYEFHRLICELGGHPLAFETIEKCKLEVERLCMLSLGRSDEVAAVMTDHEEIAYAFKNQTEAEVEALFRRHLNRLDGTIKVIHERHSEYFE